MKTKSVLIAGASGLIGQELLTLCLNDALFSEVKILVRKPMPLQHQKLKQVVVDYDTIENNATELKADYYCCTLGTTIKKAGSQDAFKKVDYEYPLQLGKIALQHDAEKYLIVTALGADKNSAIFYNKTKGAVEYALNQLRLNQLYIFQPSLLVGNRTESRPGEKAAIIASSFFNHFLIGGLKKYRSIQVKAVAKAMLFAMKNFNDKQRIIISDEIQAISDSF